jgi:hypothetical protein
LDHAGGLGASPGRGLASCMCRLGGITNRCRLTSTRVPPRDRRPRAWNPVMIFRGTSLGQLQPVSLTPGSNGVAPSSPGSANTRSTASGRSGNTPATQRGHRNPQHALQETACPHAAMIVGVGVGAGTSNSSDAVAVQTRQEVTDSPSRLPSVAGATPPIASSRSKSPTRPRLGRAPPRHCLIGTANELEAAQGSAANGSETGTHASSELLVVIAHPPPAEFAPRQQHHRQARENQDQP